MEEEEEESNEESEKPLEEKQNFPSLCRRAVRFGKTVAIGGAAIASAPVVIPPAVIGFAFSVPFGVYLAGLVYTENVMRALFLRNCQFEIDKDTTPTSLYASNANPEEIEIEDISEDDLNEKYYDGGTYANTNNVIYTVQEDENNLTSGLDKRSEDDISIIMSSSQDDKCDSELPLSPNNTESQEMMFPVQFEEEVHNDADCTDLEIQHVSENDNDRNPDAKIYYEEQKKLSELQQHGCDSVIEALGLNEALHKLEEKGISEEDHIREDIGHSFNVIEPTAELKECDTRNDDESMNVNMDSNKRKSNVEAYDDEEKKNLSTFQQHGCRLGIEALGLTEALHKLEERSISEEDDIRENSGHSFNVVEPVVELEESVTRKDNEFINEDVDSNKQDSDAETYDEVKKNLSTLQQQEYGLGIEELGLTEALHKMEDIVIAEKDRTNECDNSSFIDLEPPVENEESDISNNDESMNDDMKLDDQEIDSTDWQDDPGKEESALEDEALHNMEVRVIAEEDRTNECDNSLFIVLEPLVKNEEGDIDNNDESINVDMMLDDQEFDTMELKDGPGKEECALEEDGKIKDEVENEAIETTEFLSTGDAELEHSVHVVVGDNSHTETNQSTVTEVNEFGIGAPMLLDKQTDENEEKVIEQNEKRNESYALPFATNQPLASQLGDQQLYNPIRFDEKGTQHERDDASAKMDTEHETMLQPTPYDEEIDIKNDEIGESCPTKLENDVAGQMDYIELKNDTIIDAGKEEDNRIGTETSNEHPRETENGEAQQTAHIEFKDDTNWDVSKEEVEIPLLANIETEDKMEGNTRDNEETNLFIEQKMESANNMFDLTNVIDENLNLEDMDNKVRVQEETSENQPKTSYLFAAVMPKEVESEFIDHRNEKGTLEAKQQELTEAGSFTANDDKPLEELPTVPEEREINFEFPDFSWEKASLSPISDLDGVEEKTTMSKNFKNDVDHSNEMGIFDSKKKELDIAGSSIVKDDESVGDIQTVPEEKEINLDVPDPSSKQALSSNLNWADKKVVVVDSTEDGMYMFGEETRDEDMITNKTVEQIAAVESIVELAPVEHECENVESSISIEYACDTENHSSDITGASSRIEVAIVESSEVVHFHDQMIYSEDIIWEQIQALRTIIGCKAAMHSSMTDELKALYLLIGVEPPASLEETSDLIEVTEKLEFLKSVIGVK